MIIILIRDKRIINNIYNRCNHTLSCDTSLLNRSEVFTVTFPTPFSAVPRVMLSTNSIGYRHDDPNSPMEFKIEVSNITVNGMILYKKL